MDPVSGAASVIAVIQITTTIVAACYRYRSGAKQARKEIRLITDEVDSLRDVLKNLEALFEEEEDLQDESRLTTLSLLTKPDGPLTQCGLELERLEKKLAFPKEKLAQIGKTLFWPLKEEDSKRILDRLERFKATLNLALTADQTCVSDPLRRNRRFERLMVDGSAL